VRVDARLRLERLEILDAQLPERLVALDLGVHRSFLPVVPLLGVGDAPADLLGQGLEARLVAGQRRLQHLRVPLALPDLGVELGDLLVAPPPEGVGGDAVGAVAEPLVGAVALRVRATMRPVRRSGPGRW